MDEFALIRWIRSEVHPAEAVEAGPGDDCAVVAVAGGRLAVSTDAVVEGVHFAPGTDAYRVGWKAAAAALSDLAACACEPLAVVASCAVAPGRGHEYLKGIFRGLQDAAVRVGAGVAGGDVSRAAGEETTVCVTVLGRVPHEGMVTRGGARQGDIVFVTGRLGRSSAGRHLRFVPRVEEALRLRRLGGLHAMIDVSDGLAGDAVHIARESGVRVEIDLARLPLSDAVRRAYPEDRAAQVRHAACDGEDFELLFTVSPDGAERLLKEWDLETPVTRIGRCTAGEPGVTFLPGDTGVDPAGLKGFEHAL